MTDEFDLDNELLSHLTPGQTAWLADRTEVVTLPETHVVFGQGTSGDEMFFVLSGAVEILLEDQGVAHAVATILPAAYFGEMALIDAAPRSATA